MLVTLNWLETNYDKYNKLYWNGALPKIGFKISRSKKTWGYASYRYNFSKNSVTPLDITLSNYYDSPEDVKLTTLLHEMIHIYDYTINPHHFVSNHRKVRYDAHGLWFKSECRRLAKYGWDIEKHVTAEEKALSTLTTNSKRLETNKVREALVCVICGSNGYNWFIKTGKGHIPMVLKTIKSVNWDRTLGTVKDINFYTFDDIKLATTRSSSKSLRGWKYDNNKLLRRLEEIKATEIHPVNAGIISNIVKMAA